MIKLTTFTNENIKLLNFSFNDCTIEYFTKTQWINVFSAKQKITIKGNSFIAYDESIPKVLIDSESFSLAESWIQYFYKENQKILIISTITDEPLYIFHGDEISIIKTEDDFSKFKINEKELCINKLHWIILTHNE